jgi:hypothetical protein
MKAAAIVLLCTIAATAYGIAHDQITARLCPPSGMRALFTRPVTPSAHSPASRLW